MLAIAAVALIYALVTAGLQTVTREVEASGGVYPYKQEDWLRYLLPDLWPTDGKPLMLLAGPSTVRENLLVESFAAAFPQYRVFQGGISSGTLSDVMVALEYVERVHGSKALPRMMVLGLSPRFIAELPIDRPLAEGIQRYSPHYGVQIDPRSRATGELQPKSKLEGAVAYARFMLLKQHPRYITTVEWYTAQIFTPELSERLLATPIMSSGWARLLFSQKGRALDVGIHRFALELVSPYKYRSATNPFTDLAGLLDNPDGIWKDVFGWNPDHDTAAVRKRVDDLLAFARKHDMDIYVVNLPEGSANRVRYRPGYSDRYLALIDSAFAAVPLLNLRCLLKDDEFLDAEHARLRGAQKISQYTISFVRETLAARSAGADAGDVARKWEANDCPDLPVERYEGTIPAGHRNRVRPGVAPIAARSP